MKLPVDFTEEALHQIRSIRASKGIPEDYGLRVGAKGTGCSGVSYILGFDQQSDDDQIFEVEGVPVLVKKKDFMHLIGVQIDYVANEETVGFVFS